MTVENSAAVQRVPHDVEELGWEVEVLNNGARSELCSVVVHVFSPWMVVVFAY